MKATACAALVAGCALTSKAPPRELRYFAPELAMPAPTTAAPCGEIRLGRVDAADALRLPIVRRVSTVELVPYETMRWTEPPDAYANRALVGALFVARRLAEAVSGAAPTLDVEVTAFEEVAVGAGRGARVELRYDLHDDRRVLARGVVRREQAATAPSIEGVVAATAAALVSASDELAERIVAAACTAR